MNNEDFERQMEFILEQQTKFAESLAKHQERFDANLAEQQERSVKHQERFDANLAEQQEREAEAYVKQQQYYAQVNERMDRLDVKIAELVGFTGILRDALIGLTHHAERHDREIERHDREIGDIRLALAEQAEKGKETDARLNALMLVVERHVSGHH